MRDGAFVRLTVTRGEKTTSGTDPASNSPLGCTLVVLAEWSQAPAAGVEATSGSKLITAAAAGVNHTVGHCNLLGRVMPKLQANHAGADDAVMLDASGSVGACWQPSPAGAPMAFCPTRHVSFAPQPSPLVHHALLSPLHPVHSPLAHHLPTCPLARACPAPLHSGN